MPEWYVVFDTCGEEVALVLAYTKPGAVRSARLDGYADAATARRLHSYHDSED